jgi:hypothetical protein
LARVGTHRHWTLSAHGTRCEEGGNHRSPGVPLALRRHRERRVLGQQRDEGVDVGALERPHVAVDELAQPLVVERAERLLLATVACSLVS